MKFLNIIFLLLPFSIVGQEHLEKWTLTEIVDGDTIYARDSLGNNVKFRLIGIDAPESRHPFKPVEAYSGEATKKMYDLLDSEFIYIEYDVQRLDRYGRTLAYVYTSGKEQVNSILLREGLAKITTYPPNVKYVETYYKDQKIAQTHRKGIWSH